MKRRTFQIMIMTVFLAMLAFPGQVFDGACDGLLLWFRTVLPTLLPFLILSNLLIRTGGVHILAGVLGPCIRHLFHVSDHGSFAVLTGFLCGYPMGAKTTSELVLSGDISEKEGAYLLSFCNNASPMFIMNYVVLQNLKRQDLVIPTLGILLLSPICCSFLFRRFHQTAIRRSDVSGERKQGSFDLRVVDVSIMDGFEAITKVGGYIILFSVGIALLRQFPVRNIFWNALMLPSLEVTGGVLMIQKLALPFSVRYVLTLALVSFGGVCSIAQTQCMIQKTSINRMPYVIEKLVTAVVTSMFAILFLMLYSS